jgi:predicted PurR-regulated permease PerM
MTVTAAIGDALRLATAGIQLWLLRILARKGLRTRFPIFFCYTAFVAVTVPLMTAVSWIFVWGRDSYTEYFYTFWAQEAVCSVLRF